MAIRILQNASLVATLEDLNDLKTALLSLAEAAPEDRVTEVTVQLDGALYSLTQPLVLDGEQEPSLKRLRLTLEAAEGEKPLITSLASLDPTLFQKVSEGVYACTLPQDDKGCYPVFRTLYNGASRVPLSRGETSVYPFGFVNHYGGYGGKEEVAEYHGGLYVAYDVAKALADAQRIEPTEMMMLVEWEFIIVHVTGVDLKDTVEHEGKTYAHVKIRDDHLWSMIQSTNPCIGTKNRPFFFANNPVFLTENTFSYDYRTGTLFYMPTKGKTIEEVNLFYPTLENLVTLKGLRNTTLKGITFTGVDSFYTVENGYHSGQANNEKRAGKLQHAALFTASMTDFTVDGCDFHDIGCNGALMTDRNVRVSVINSRFTEIAMTAISIGNATIEWENPLNQNFELTVENNLISHIGYEYPAAVAVYIGQVDGLSLAHNTIEYTAYSGISCGWGWALVDYSLGEKINIRNADIAYNRLENTMDVLYDGAAIYVVGANCHKGYTRQFNAMHHNFAKRDVMTRARHAYYLDGSSSNWEVYENVTHGDDLPVFSQFNVPSQYTWHNHIHDIYSTKEISEKNNVPERDMVVGTCYIVPEGLEALFEQYPHARELYENSGCKL